MEQDHTTPHPDTTPSDHPPQTEEVGGMPAQALQQLEDQHARLCAEFDNFRRRTQKERIALVQHANERLLLSLLPVLDDFERALQAEKDKDTTGVQLIYDKLLRLLIQEGLKSMEVEPGSVLDTTLHNAIAEVPVQQESQAGAIVEVTQKGYFVGEKVLRCAQVVVGKSQVK